MPDVSVRFWLRRRWIAAPISVSIPTDRFFPSQDTMPAGRFGNLIALPLQGFPQSDGRRNCSRTAKEELRRAAEPRALRVIHENKNGMIGDPGIFILRQYRQHGEDELRAQEVFEIAMRHLGIDDRDAFFMRVVELIAITWLTKDDRQAVEQLLSEQRYLDLVRP
jgi:hypothetical protein